MTTRVDDDRDLSDEDLADEDPADPADEATDDDAADDERDDDDLAEAGDDPPDDDGPARWSRFFSPRRLTIALGVVAALLVGTGTWALIAAAGLRDSPAAHNSALVDTGRTAEVSASVSNALKQIFSYSYDKTEVTDKAAKDVLR